MSDQKIKSCPNCNSEIKESIFSDNPLIDTTKVDFINSFTENSSIGYCGKCSNALFKNASNKFREIRKTKNENKEKLSKRLLELIDSVPIITLHNPQDWKYKSLEIVSAQSVIGTGVITEIASNWTDFFGLESSRYNEKLKNGEENCKRILRYSALKMGGNAILGTDIDYSEAGAGKGMLMVCMAGTAVSITNLKELNYNIEGLNELEKIPENLNAIELELENLTKFNMFSPNY